MRSPFAVVATLGHRFDRERTGWRDTKALILVVAQEGRDEAWAGAEALAYALGLDPTTIEAIYREVYEAGPPARDPLQRRHRERQRT